MTHSELIKSMKKTLIGLCHSNAMASELGFKIKKNYKSLSIQTPASKAVYVVTLDRHLKTIAA